MIHAGADLRPTWGARSGKPFCRPCFRVSGMTAAGRHRARTRCSHLTSVQDRPTQQCRVILVFVDEATENGAALDPLLGEVGDGVIGPRRAEFAAAVGSLYPARTVRRCGPGAEIPAQVRMARFPGTHRPDYECGRSRRWTVVPSESRRAQVNRLTSPSSMSGRPGMGQVVTQVIEVGPGPLRAHWLRDRCGVGECLIPGGDPQPVEDPAVAGIVVESGQRSSTPRVAISRSSAPSSSRA